MSVKELGYIILGSRDVEAWRPFATNIMGAMVATAPGGALYLKFDDLAYRIIVAPADKSRLLTCGWCVNDRTEYEAAIAYLAQSGIEAREGDIEACDLRRVEQFAAFTDPGGTDHEISWGRTYDGAPFRPSVDVSGFVSSGPNGFGHVVVPVLPGSYDRNLEFWLGMSGFGVADFAARQIGSSTVKSRVHFLHCANARQHSMAPIERDSPLGLLHFMVEALTIDDVGRALDRCLDAGVPIARTLGRHINDDVVSFYVETPDGFVMEYGAGGKLMDWATHEPVHYARGSHWGHVWTT